MNLRMPERVRVDAVTQAAMDMEVAPFLHELAPLGDAETPDAVLGGSRMAQRFVLGELEGKSVLVVTSGTGPANAACATARALALADTPVVIAAGTTGGLARDISVGDIAAGTTAIYGQADATAFGYAPGQISQMLVDYTSPEAVAARPDDLFDMISHRVRIGQVLSSDSFCMQEHVEPVCRRFPDAIATDMETCAMAQVRWSVGVDWISLRAASDLCEPSADQVFHMDGKRVASHSADAVAAYLRML